MTNWIEMDGKQIKIFYYIVRDEGVAPYVDISGGNTLTLSVENMGDRAEIWIVSETDGKESARYNARSVETIVWL